MAAVMLAVLLGWGPIAAGAEGPKGATFTESVAGVRRAMAQRDLDLAAQHLKAASEAAKTQAQQDEVDRLRSLLDYQRQFWDLLAKGAAKLQAGDELMVGKTRVAVVEVANGQIVIKAAGQLHRYPLKKMPTSLAMALAERSLAKDPVSKVVVGAFLAMDAKGDRKAAKRLWDDALKAGLDVGHLKAELKVPPGGKTAAPTDQGKLTIAESQIQQEYKHLYSRVGIPVWREELIRKFLADAPKQTNDPVRRFVMLRDARDMAAAAGQMREAEQAIDAIARYYDVDVIKMKLDVLEKLAASARGLDAVRETTLATLDLADQAVKAGRLEEAAAAAKIAIQAARKTRNRLLMQQAIIAQREIEQRRHPQGPPRR